VGWDRLCGGGIRVTSAALILFLAFIALASGPGSELKMTATALAIGILLDATVIRALIVPAVIALMGRWNWWLPTWPARLLRVPPSLPPRHAGREGEAPTRNSPALLSRARSRFAAIYLPLAILQWQFSVQTTQGAFLQDF
jgi:hypothetical protein